MKNRHSDSWTFKHQPLDYDPHEHPKNGPKIEKFKAKTPIQAALVRDVMIAYNYGSYDLELKPNKRNFTDGQLDCILELVVMLHRKKNIGFEPFIRPDYALDFSAISKELLDHIQDPEGFELTDDNKELAGILNMKSNYKRIKRNEDTNHWDFQLRLFDKSKAETFVFGAKEQIQAAIARELELIVLGDRIYNPTLEPNARNFTDTQLIQIVDLIKKIKKEKGKPFGPDDMPFGPDTTVTDEEYADLISMMQKSFDKPEDYELTDDNEELSKILNSLEPISYEKEEKYSGEAIKAYNFIKDVYMRHAKSAYDEVSEYIAGEFFDNDEKRIMNITPVKEKAGSYNELCRMLSSQDDGGPSRTWLYNALYLLQDGMRLKQIEDVQTVHTYEQLSVSHKVQLTREHDLDKKIKLINQIAEGRKDEDGNVIVSSSGEPIPLSVRETKKLISPAKKKPLTYNEVLVSIANTLSNGLWVLKGLSMSEKKTVDYKAIEKRVGEMHEEIGSFIK